jgi:hypothetical protein
MCGLVKKIADEVHVANACGTQNLRIAINNRGIGPWLQTGKVEKD